MRRLGGGRGDRPDSERVVLLGRVVGLETGELAEERHDAMMMARQLPWSRLAVATRQPTAGGRQPFADG